MGKLTEHKLAELLPCPFCGRTDLVIHEDISEDEPKRSYAFHVFCRDCHCHGRNNFPIGWAESHDAAIEAWNRRLQSSSASIEAVSGDWVKPLEWYRVTPRLSLQRASTAFGEYRVWVANEETWFWAFNDQRHSDGANDTENEVKAAAQADFAARILSSLQSSAAPDTKSEAVSYAALLEVAIKTAHELAIQVQIGPEPDEALDHLITLTAALDGGE